MTRTSFLRLAGSRSFESFTPSAFSFGTSLSSIATPATTRGPRTEPLPASSTPATIKYPSPHSFLVSRHFFSSIRAFPSKFHPEDYLYFRRLRRKVSIPDYTSILLSRDRQGLPDLRTASPTPRLNSGLKSSIGPTSSQTTISELTFACSNAFWARVASVFKLTRYFPTLGPGMRSVLARLEDSSEAMSNSRKPVLSPWFLTSLVRTPPTVKP